MEANTEFSFSITQQSWRIMLKVLYMYYRYFPLIWRFLRPGKLSTENSENIELQNAIEIKLHCTTFALCETCITVHCTLTNLWKTLGAWSAGSAEAGGPVRGFTISAFPFQASLT